MSIMRASGRKARIARSSPIRCGPRIRNGSECVPERKLFNSSGGNPATENGFMSIQPRVRAQLFNDVSPTAKPQNFCHVERSRDISYYFCRRHAGKTETVRDYSTSVGMTK